MPVYDYITVGAGSAGCSWRIRLAAWGRLTVPLLEAGVVMIAETAADMILTGSGD